VLEYASAASPNQWQPIIPAVSQPVVDDFFTTWVPPGPGNYFVRLTVTDLAGNSRQAIKSVSWTETPSITDVFLTPPIFSPNGDGVNDTASIHYRVLEPVHLSFSFYNSAGVRVRTIVRDDSTIGDDVTLLWDGRDDNGLTVPDDKYRMTVLDYEFFITVDNTPPSVPADIRPAYEPQGGGPGGGAAVASVDPGLEWSVTDLHLNGPVDDRERLWATILRNGILPLSGRAPVIRGSRTGRIANSVPSLDQFREPPVQDHGLRQPRETKRS